MNRKDQLIQDLKNRLNFVMETMGVLLYEWDIATDQITWFGDIDKCLGYPQNQFSRTVEARYEIIHPDDKTRVVNGVKRRLKDGEEYFYEEYRVVRKNEGILYWSDSAKIFFDNNKTPYKWIGVTLDKTVQKKALESIQKAKE